MTPTAKNIKALIIDNDNDILYVLKEVLIYEGYEVVSLLEVDNIFPEIMTHRPDIIILDYMLNGITGGELCQQIKANRYTQQLPVIIISAYPKATQSLADCGCNHFIAKPFDLDHIVNSIKDLTTEKVQF